MRIPGVKNSRINKPRYRRRIVPELHKKVKVEVRWQMRYLFVFKYLYMTPRVLKTIHPMVPVGPIGFL
jgi:hypothetical protein